MKTKLLILLTIFLIGALVACSPASGSEAAALSNGDAGVENPEGTRVETAGNSRLNNDYDGALSIQGQLAVGTLLLEETELAVDEALAADLTIMASRTKPEQ